MARSSDIGPAHLALQLLVGMSNAPARLLESSCGQVTLTVTQDCLGSAEYRTWHKVDLTEGPTGHDKDF